MIVLSSLLLGLSRAAYLPLSNVQYPVYHPNDRVEIYGPELKQLADSDRWAIEAVNRDDELNTVQLLCELVQEKNFRLWPSQVENEEPLPLTKPGAWYLSCTFGIPSDLENDGEYYIRGAFFEDDARYVDYDTITFSIDTDRQPRKHRFVTDMFTDVDIARERPRTSALVRGAPKISGLAPSNGSPLGQIYLTIYGDNLKSQQIDLGGTSDNEETGEGENYKIWGEREGDRVDCHLDRMLTLHGRPLNGAQFVVCLFPAVPFVGRWYIKMTIDDGDILNAGHMNIEEGYAPKVYHFYPSASAPARPRGSWDYDGAFWTSWYNIDNPSDGVEEESFTEIYSRNRADFQHCTSPVKIQAWNTELDEEFLTTANVNADGRCDTAFFSPFEGVRCEDALQSIETIKCPDIKVRFYCIPGITEIWGRQFTDVVARLDDEDFHANRLHEQPKVVDDNDGFKSELKIFLNDGQNCGTHENCGISHEMQVSIKNGNDGIIQMLPKAPIPGAYNFTYQTHHQGRAYVHGRYQNWFGNEDLLPTSFEIYPQINSVSPQIGSVNGGAILTVTGTGFTSDGKGGTVSIQVGGVDCEVLTMTETEITCRVAAGEEAEGSWYENRQFVPLDGFEYAHFKYFSRATGSAEKCEDLCRRDAKCMAWVWETKDDCDHYDYVGEDRVGADKEFATTADWIAAHWAPETDAFGGYFNADNHVEETDCYSGRGYFYNGTAVAGQWDGVCAEGSFCRNPSPQTHAMPYCQTAEGHWRNCQIRRCDEKTGAFLGNRGFDVKVMRGHTGDYDLEWKRTTADYELADHLSHRDMDGLLMGGKFSNSKKHLYGENSPYQENWSVRGETNFIPPLDGVYKFIFAVDDDLAASTVSDQSSGEWERVGLIYGACSENDKQCRNYAPSHSKFYTLSKGETFPLTVSAANGGGPGFAYVGVQYFGKDGMGTWHDLKRDADEKLYEAAYIDARQDIYFEQDRNRDAQWINVAWDVELKDNGVGLGDGESFDDDVSPRFQMEICGDDYCVETGTLAGYDKDHTGTFEDTVRDIMELYFSAECTKTGSMNPIHFQNDYEENNYWPDQWHRTRSVGAWCGKRVLRTHHWDIFNHHAQKNGNQNVGPANGFETGDFCFAHRGDIDKILLYVRYSYVRTDGSTGHWQNWAYVPITGHTNNEESWQWGCWNALDLIDSHIAYKGYDHTRTEDQFLIYHIQLRNDEVMPIFVDEFVLGKMREPYEMQVTRPQFKQGGTAIWKIHVDKYSKSGGSAYRFTWNDYHDYPVNGYISPLIKIKAPSDVTLAADSDAATDSTGADWTSMSPVPVNVWDAAIAVQDENDYGFQEGITREYLYGRFNYKNSNNVRHILHVHVFRKSYINEDPRGEMTITYGDSPTELTLPFGSHISQYTIQDALHETWPELQDDGLKVRVSRYGSAQWGPRFRIQAYEHGQMKMFALKSFTLNTNGRHQNFRSGTEERTRAGIYSPILPGSLTATSHDQPQVVVIANGQRSACDNCDFRYSNAHTVSVTSVSVADGDAVSLGDSITVNFNKNSYSGTLKNANIHIDGVASTDCSNTASSVTCTVGQVPVGSWEVVLHIPENGDAPSGVFVSVSSSVTSSTPTTGSNNGGQIVTASGTGFRAGQVVQVSMNGEVVDCDSTGFEVTYDTLVCRTAAHTDCLPGCAGPTPILSSLSQSELTVIGGETITLTGNGFSSSCDDDTSSVMIGDNTATVLSWSDTEIVARTSAMSAAAVADIKVDVCGVGYSDSVSGSTQLQIRGIGGAFSSLIGGRLITINGDGFAHSESSTDDVTVMVGEDSCDVKSADYNQIVCQTAGVSTRHRLIVGAGGIMDAAGSMSGVTTIEVGDEIEWWWNIQIGGTVPKFEFERTSEAGSVSTGGAKWSPPIYGDQNSFIHQFVAEGTYHYSTGYIDGATIFQSGTIIVVGATDKAARVSVTIGDNEAAHVAARKRKNQPAGNCNSVAGVTSAEASVDADHYVFYSLIATPRIVDFTINAQAPFEHSSTPVNAEVVVNFDSYDVDSCASYIEIEVFNNEGSYPCSGSGSGNQYTCTIDPSAGLSIYKDNKLRISIATMGDVYFLDYNAVTDEDTFSSVVQVDEAFELDMDSAITSVSPAPISLLGDVELTISGFGFACDESSETFSIGYEGSNASFACTTLSASYDEVTCHLQKVAVDVSDVSRPSEFTVSGDWGSSAQLAVSDAMTPKVTAVEVAADKASVTVIGSDLDALVGTIDGESFDCSGGSCALPAVGAGLHKLTWRSTVGAATFVDSAVEIVPEVASVSPVSGGSNGGFRITITGTGFDEDTIVTFSDDFGAVVEKYAYKTIESASTIVVSSPAGVGSYSLVVSHEFLDTSNTPVTITLADSDSSITGTSDASAVVGGDSVTVSGSFLDCENTNMEFSVYKDPCASGNHHCHKNAECIPDGFSYTCSCIDENADQWYGKSHWGDGYTCHNLDRPGNVATPEEAIQKCTDSRRYIFNVVTEQDRLDLIDILNTAGLVNRGHWVQIDGVMTCAKVNEAGDALLTEEDLGACDSWGADVDGGDVEKRPLCTRYTFDNCFDDDVDFRGRYTYNGRISKTLFGHECLPWDTTGDSEWSGSDSFCRNPHWSTNGPTCYTGFNKNGVDLNRVTCNVPSCAELKSREMKNCMIESWAPIDTDRIDNYDTSTYKNCWIGSVGSGTELNNPRRCYDGSGDERGVDFIPVDASRNIYAMRFSNDEDYEYLYSEGDLIKRATEGQNLSPDNEQCQFVVDPDFFGPGRWALRQGDLHWRARPSNKGDLLFEAINLDEAESVDEYAWKITCRADHFGSLIEQPTAPNTIVTEQALTCSGDFSGDLAVTMPPLPAGSYKMNTRGASGISDIVDVTYALVVCSVTPNTVGAGGGTEITLAGAGFSEATSAILCDTPLEQISVSNTEAVFMTVPVDMSNCTTVFSVVAVDAADGSEIVAAGFARNLFTVDESLSPTISGVNPKRGGTAGGTQLTITGSGFGSSVADTTVTVANSACTVSSVTDTEIVCETGIFDRTQVQEPVMPVVTIAGGPGQAVADTSAAESDIQFWYIDRWSSPYTWGCSDDSCKPQEGEIIVIPAGQVILLDETTPVLAVLIVDGGKFIWDRKDGIELHMQYGVINNGGSFEIGTEEEPFCEGNAMIQLYGHQRSINLPIYGAKVLAVRFGSLDFHGCPKTTTWTELDVTAEAGDSQITLTHPVKDDWFVGNEIIIAATGDITNFHRSEKRVIADVSDDGYTVTLTEALEHRHFAVCSEGPAGSTFGWGWAGTICTRAEVGLLTRNILFRGDFQESWAEELDECEAGVGTAFGTQTCFQNRYGHETGSDQFGAILFLHKPSHAKIEFTEFTHAGQAFNLARYPIHFHTPGSLPTSYVRGNGIHNTFNRALTMHGVHNLTVEYNVIYNVMGLAFFLEDAVEEDNILRYNLGIMNKKSSSLLNIDSTPAVFWIPNPNNIFYGNRAAGGTHFGFWFNPSDEPTGPSAQMEEYQNFCVKNRPLGAFYNNTAHSMGKYGMWIFVDLTPTASGECDDPTPKAIKFGELPAENENGPIPEDTFGFFAWHCERGAEFATGGAIQFLNMITANNWIANLAGKESFLHTYGEEGMEDQISMFKRNIVIGHLDGDPELKACGDMGIETPWKFFAFTVDDIAFYNYDTTTPDLASAEIPSDAAERRCVAFDPCYGSNAFDCGAITWFSKVSWFNSNRRMTHAWEHEAAVLDRDGSFSEGTPGTYVISKSDAYNKNLCSDDTSGKYAIEGSFPAQICEPSGGGKFFKPHRFMFNSAKPDSLEGMEAVFTGEHGTAKSPFRNCRPRGNGWMVLLDGNQEYEMHFANMDHISNISFTGDIDDFETGEWLTIRHDFPEKVDTATLRNDDVQVKVEEWPADPLSVDPYTYHVENVTEPYSVRYTFNGNWNTESPGLDGDALSFGQNFLIKPEFYKCFYKDCIPPPPEPGTAEGELVECNFIECAMQDDFAPLHVQETQHVKFDRSAFIASGGTVKLGETIVDGTFEVEAAALQEGDTLTIEADNFLINSHTDPADIGRKRRDTFVYNNGKIVIGSEDAPIPCGTQVVIKINGDKSSKSYGATPGNPPIGPKAMGGFGGIEMYGCAPANTWVQLMTTVNAGASAITVMGDIAGWKAGDEIAVASTSYEHRHTEYVTIQSISGNVIAIFPALEHRHTGAATSTQTINGVDYNQAAEVTLLTRSIKIDGTDSTDDKVGGRIVLMNWIRMNGAHFYEHHGYGQFSNVQFTGMGQYAYTSYDDNRAAIMFWGIDTTADEALGRKASFVKGCAFHDLYHTAIAALFDTDNLVIDNNIIMGVVDDAIRTDGAGTVITNNVIGNVEATALYKGAFASGTNVNFEEDQLPSCVNIQGSTDTVLTGNRCTGSDGSCFQTDGEACDVSEMCSFNTNGFSYSNNMGHSCAIGHWNLNGGDTCSKYGGYYFYKIAYYGFQWLSDKDYHIVEDSVVVDAKVGFYGVSIKPGQDKRNTVKNTYFAGKSDFYDCAYDADVHKDMELSKHAGSLNPKIVKNHAAVLFPDFHADKNGFPICEMFAADVDPNNHGLTCMLDCHFANYNAKCGGRDFLFNTNPKTMDWTFPIQLLGGNQKTNVNNEDLVHFDRPTLDKVNIADCVDLHADANKHAKVMDIDGGVFDVPGTLFAESEYEWDGVTRPTADGGSVTYSDTQDGLGDYRIPKPLITAMDGSKIPIDDVIQERGIVRNQNCDYRPEGPAWFCPLSDFRYYDLVYDMMDNDKMSRRLTPLALVANGHADIINGPCDHSCCIGYACSLRLMTLHSTVACGQEYDYYFSSTTPLKAKWYFADAPADCKILIKFYSKRPNRLNFFKDGQLSLATNAVLMGDSISWSKPDPSFYPGLTDSIYNHGGANYHDRNNQLFYMILSGGSEYDLEVVSSLVLELGVMTEVTEDEFYDNGNLAANIAALLGIDPSKIRLMNVISETGAQRRKRRAALGYDVINVDVNPRFRNRRQEDAPGMTLGFEIDPSSNTANGAEANNKLGAQIAGSGGAIVNNVMNTTQTEIDPSATADESVAIAAAPEPPPEEPEMPETLADILGIDNIAEGESIEDFLEKVEEALDVPLDDLETAEEKNAAKQAAADAALEAVVYTSPAELLVLSEPTEPQILGLDFYQKFSFAMKDTNGEIMPIVGFVATPWNIKVTFGDQVVTSGPASPNLDGLTSVDFTPGDGRSIFDNLVVKGDVVSANFVFTAVDPSVAEDTGISWTSPVVEFLPPADTSVCDAKPEGSPFDKKMAFSPDCSYVCITGCTSVGAAPVCETLSSCDASSFSACGDSGCECDMSLVPEVESIDVADYISGTCDGAGLTMRVNKCVVNKLGLMLKDIHVVGEQDDDFSSIAADANCRGRLGFDAGAEYVFRINRSKSECGASTSYNSTHVTYTAGIQGYKMVSDFFQRDVAEFWSSFECSYPIDLSSYTELATAQKMDNVVEGRNVMVAKYTNAGYHTVAPTDQVISSSSMISDLGMVAPEGFQLEANRCWFSDAYNADDENAGNVIEVVTDGCLTSGQEGFVSISEGWSGTNQFRLMVTDSVLGDLASDVVYFNCMVSLCDLDSGSCSDASCPGSNTASGTQIRVYTELNVDNSAGVADCDANADNCENCKATINGGVCFCPDGFTLQPDNTCAASSSRATKTSKGKWSSKKPWQKKWKN